MVAKTRYIVYFGDVYTTAIDWKDLLSYIKWLREMRLPRPTKIVDLRILWMDEPFEGVEPQSWEETATRLQTEKIELRDEVERKRDAILTHREVHIA